MYTYVQRPGCKKENTATYVYIRAGSRTPTRAYIRTARARVHGWVRTEEQRRPRVHGEPTGWVGTECVVVFIGRAWTEQPMETRPGVLQNGGNGLVFDQPRSKRDPVHREGCGVPQNGTPRDTVHLHRRPPPASTGYRSSTVDLLQPPLATVHPRAPVHPASTARYSTASSSTTPPRAPLHRLLFIQPSTPRGPVHPPPPGTVHPNPPATLTVHPEAMPRGPVHPPPSGTVHPNRAPNNAHCSSRGSIDRLQLAAVAKESLDRVQLTAIDRSLGFSNA